MWGCGGEGVRQFVGTHARVAALVCLCWVGWDGVCAPARAACVCVGSVIAVGVGCLPVCVCVCVWVLPLGGGTSGSHGRSYWLALPCPLAPAAGGRGVWRRINHFVLRPPSALCTAPFPWRVTWRRRGLGTGALEMPGPSPMTRTRSDWDWPVDNA